MTPCHTGARVEGHYCSPGNLEIIAYPEEIKNSSLNLHDLARCLDNSVKPLIGGVYYELALFKVEQFSFDTDSWM